ncbi:response regulator transcription factor [Paenactinomyces guangxiensis]|uniref:Response regulator transcription factor n=1 Tax=Paenactinomyces guangxiensis TaxID=1490290 RepID=A0A7W1WTB0_9BACL|nr:response regulator transcription factor [Paenactinomyces guangxiensis]MBA4495446.1 response regulator transcription factor [Paenactinomyces guangxiensis]MBH8592431.1 response regulator transcription factor [Paenactinomyces guangxiensis]
MKKRILIVDDEEKIVSTICDTLAQEDFEPLPELNGENAIHRLKSGEKIHLVLLDWMMPGISGLEVCKQIRSFSDVPIIFLTAKSDEYDKLLGLELGADDYITKPFSMRELVTRIRVVLRRFPVSSVNGAADEERIVYKDLIVDPAQYKVWLQGNEVVCTHTEFKILSTLAAHPGRVYSRSQLLEIALGEEYIGYERSIDTHIHNLRKKMKAACPLFAGIRTVFGVGYTLGDAS